MVRLVSILILAVWAFGCGGTDTCPRGDCAEGGNGGKGGESSSTSEGGGGGQSSTSESGSGGEGGCSMADPSGCVFPNEYTLDPAVDLTEDALVEALIDNPVSCRPFIRGNSEDGSWTRVVMNVPPGKYNFGRFVISDDPGIGIVPQDGDVWIIAVGVVGIGLNPDDFGCELIAETRPVFEVGTVNLVNPATMAESWFRVLEFDHSELETTDGNSLFYCFRNTVYGDGTRTGIIGCGPDACVDGRDQWQDNTTPPFVGKIQDMSSYGPNYCVSWEAKTYQ